MTEIQKSETQETGVTLWTPPPIDEWMKGGSDLLPYNLARQEDLSDGTAPMGTENIDAGDLTLPSLKLLQDKSDEVEDETFPEAKAGMFCHSTTRQLYHAPLRVLVVHHFKTRAMFEDLRTKQKGLKKCLSRDTFEGTVYGSCEACSYKEWGETGDVSLDKPFCSLQNNFVIILPDGSPAVLRFGKTSFKGSKPFLSDIALAQNRKKMWAHPAIVRIKKQPRVVDGKTSYYFVAMLNWDQRYVVPPGIRNDCTQSHLLLKATYEQGKLDVEGGDKDDGIPDVD